MLFPFLLLALSSLSIVSLLRRSPLSSLASLHGPSLSPALEKKSLKKAIEETLERELRQKSLVVLRQTDGRQTLDLIPQLASLTISEFFLFFARITTRSTNPRSRKEKKIEDEAKGRKVEDMEQTDGEDDYGEDNYVEDDYEEGDE